jgi:hypothetical protein
MSEPNDSVGKRAKGNDFIANIRADDAVEASRQRAIAPPQQRRRATKPVGVGGYTGQALANEAGQLANATKGTRNDVLNTAAFNLGQLVQPGGLDFDAVVSELTRAALASGLTRKELKQWDLPDRGIKAGMLRLRDIAEIQSNATYVSNTPNARIPISAETKTSKPVTTGGDDEGDPERVITFKRASAVRKRVPQWVWRHGDEGRIQLGTVSMFAGKPAAGKSTASRWFAAQVTRGTLPGIWEGVPMNVAMVSVEEQEDTTVVPSLEVSGADLDRVFLPEVIDAGRESMFGSIRDEEQFTKLLIDKDIRAVFIDPVMSTFGGKADVYRNNEVREYLNPFVRMAQAINGFVICVHHLRKGTVSDVLGAMNGSSAFGEVPRAVFGFAPFESGAHVMEQVKNSAGPTDLKLEYHLPIQYTTDDDGVPFELPKFEIKGNTTVSISDIDEARDELTGIAFTAQWLTDYLMENQPAPVWAIQKDAKSAGVVNNEKMLSRASKRVGVVSKSQPVKDKPNQHVWMLPEYAEGYRAQWQVTLRDDD